MVAICTVQARFTRSTVAKLLAPPFKVRNQTKHVLI
jgi:hypothetical protein